MMASTPLASTARAFAALGLWLALSLSASSCQTRDINDPLPGGADPIAQAVRKAAETKERQLVFEDDFEREQPGARYKRGKGEAGSGRWRVEGGWLRAQDIKNDPLWLKMALPEKVRVEFDAQALSPTGDLKVEIFGDNSVHATGYILIFGGWNNSLDVIARLDEHGKDRKQRRSRGVRPNQTYRMAIERGEDGKLKWFVDGKPFMTYDDPKPLRGDKHRHFAFNDWAAPVRFDNLKVYALP